MDVYSITVYVYPGIPINIPYENVQIMINYQPPGSASPIFFNERLLMGLRALAITLCRGDPAIT